MRIGLKEFRAFAKTGMIDIKPLTFLVGENSAGKSSFLSALNYIWRFQERSTGPSFNTPPFDLGTFDEIVHRVRGRTRPERFSIQVENQILVDSQRRFNIGIKNQRDRITGTAQLNLTFANNVGESQLTTVKLSFNNCELVFDIAEDISAKLYQENRLIFDSFGGEEKLPLPLSSANSLKIDVSYLTYYLRRVLVDLVSKREDLSNPVAVSLNMMTSAFGALTETFPRNVFASAPVRSSPSRVYTPTDQSRSPEGRHTPQILFKIKETDEARWDKIKSGLEEFGQLSGMFSRIDVARYRRSGSSPFQINITIKGKQSNIIDVGYGVSQALPILTDLIEASPRSGFLFQQPEVHLHPQAQAALGSFIARYVGQHRGSYIVAETHSDYMIDRVRYEAKVGNIRSQDVAILYFESSGTNVSVHQIGLDPEGNVTNAPASYREFFTTEQMRILGFEI